MPGMLLPFFLIQFHPNAYKSPSNGLYMFSCWKLFSSNCNEIYFLLSCSLELTGLIE